jgi:hypothetical protein
MSKIAGMAFIRIDGQQFSTNGEFEATSQGFKATPIPASDGTIHYSEEVVADKVSGTLLTTTELDPQTVVDARDVTVQIEFKNGKVFILKNGFFTGDPTISSKDGTMSVEWSGKGRWMS